MKPVYTGKGKRPGSKKNRAGNIVPIPTMHYLHGAAARKQLIRRPPKTEEPIFPAEVAAA
jgi:hypothetical protein